MLRSPSTGRSRLSPFPPAYERWQRVDLQRISQVHNLHSGCEAMSNECEGLTAVLYDKVSNTARTSGPSHGWGSWGTGTAREHRRGRALHRDAVRLEPGPPAVPGCHRAHRPLLQVFPVLKGFVLKDGVGAVFPVFKGRGSEVSSRGPLSDRLRTRSDERRDFVLVRCPSVHRDGGADRDDCDQ